jgi:hypothetical protein
VLLLQSLVDSPDLINGYFTNELVAEGASLMMVILSHDQFTQPIVFKGTSAHSRLVYALYKFGSNISEFPLSRKKPLEALYQWILL